MKLALLKFDTAMTKEKISTQALKLSEKTQTEIAEAWKELKEGKGIEHKKLMDELSRIIKLKKS